MDIINVIGKNNTQIDKFYWDGLSLDWRKLLDEQNVKVRIFFNKY